MRSLVFDLETSSKYPVGQIINYAFVLYDEKFLELERCHGEIKLSPLELPEAGAILANRVDVKRLMHSDAPNERLGLKRVHEFLSKIADDAARAGSALAMLGFNSFRFDIPYLRTSLIRNGLNPYLGKWVLNRDVLPAVRWLSCTQEKFPRLVNPKEPEKLSLRLETLAHHYGLLTGVQSHESLEDVQLTAKVISALHQESFGIDVRSFQSYQPTREHERYGQVVYQLRPNYDLSKSHLSELVPMMFLCASSSGALWVDLERFLECRSKAAIRWFSKSTGSFFVGTTSTLPLSVSSEHSDEIVRESFLKEVQQVCAGVTLDNYFTTSVCDIEQDIYRLDFDARDALTRSIWACDRSKLDSLGNKDAKSLAVRAYLKELDWSKPEKELPLGLLRRYAEYRYGIASGAETSQPRLLLPRSHSPEREAQGEAQYHPSFEEITSSVEGMLTNPTAEDQQLLESLQWWYGECPLARVAVR
jgi:DNA polymerase III epsilon subunit-like protein